MRYDFDGIARGESWSREFRFRDAQDQPVDLTGRTVRFLLRDTDGMLADITSGTPDPDGSIAVTPADGLVIVTVKPAVTAAASTPAEYTLWLDVGLDTADATVWGSWRTVRVVTPVA
ncbi:hypothetical protein [Yinghuangia soli]|uniref:Uncharacterized protein n=1 Tax=Yinghuangia soli TaxID=2908204 RepID=A0AA41Q549_9ACTN|nr:hypothetical protein [Yinghuangia soli]MCF2531738.1 hypothetical protein [Yinghuangia soli]